MLFFQRSLFSTASSVHTYMPGAVFGNKIYFTDDKNSESKLTKLQFFTYLMQFVLNKSFT
jgi:hypothetical protein